MMAWFIKELARVAIAIAAVGVGFVTNWFMLWVGLPWYDNHEPYFLIALIAVSFGRDFAPQQGEGRPR